MEKLPERTQGKGAYLQLWISLTNISAWRSLKAARANQYYITQSMHVQVWHNRKNFSESLVPNIYTNIARLQFHEMS